MSLEQALAANTAALEALTAALAGAKVGGTAASTGTEKPATEKAAAKPGRPAKEKPAAPVRTREELAAVLTELKEKSGGTEAPRKLITSVGGVEKSKDIPDDKIDAVYEAVKAALVELEGEDDDV